MKNLQYNFYVEKQTKSYILDINQTLTRDIKKEK